MSEMPAGVISAQASRFGDVSLKRAAPSASAPVKRGGLGRAIFAATLLSAIAVGWTLRDERFLTPENGVGYALGIIGGSIILSLLFYPLRKRFRRLRPVGGVSLLFRIHMALGLIGPTLILFHANFSLGSANSNAALFCMSTVVLSGLIGRYLYARTHVGLSAERRAVRSFLDDAHEVRPELAQLLDWDPAIADELRAFERDVAAQPGSLFSSIRHASVVGSRARRSQAALVGDVRSMLKGSGLSWMRRRRVSRRLTRALSEYFTCIRRAATLAVYERVFALWRLLHLPLFAVLGVAVVVHVIAVHLY